MNRRLGIATAMLLALLILVPGVAAAGPWTWGRTQPLIVASGTDITLPADQDVDLLVVFGGHARIEGDARSIFVFGGSADLIGSRTNGIVAAQSQVSIDATSVVSGDIRAMDSTITGATATTVTGRIRDLGPDIALGWFGIGSVLFLIYVAFAVSLLLTGVLAAGLAGRQLREAANLIHREPVSVGLAAIVGLIAVISVAILAMITIVAIPFGLGLLILVLPALFLAGYIVVGVWLGEIVLARTSPGVVRERPYLAAAIGLLIVGVLSVFPPIGGLLSLVGFGAVLLLMWRVIRRGRAVEPRLQRAAEVAASAG